MKTMKMMLVAAACAVQFVMADEAKEASAPLAGDVAVQAYVQGTEAQTAVQPSEKPTTCSAPRKTRRSKAASAMKGEGTKTAPKKRRSRKVSVEQAAEASTPGMACMR